MISTKFLGTGQVMFVIGVLGIGAYMFEIVPDPNIFQVSAGMAVLGAVLTILGIVAVAGGAVGDSISDSRGIHAGDGSVFSVGLLRCMLAITIADDRIDDTEIAQMKRIFKHLTGSPVDEETIRYTADQMLEEGADIKTELETIAPTLNKPLKKNIIVASLYILAADGVMDEDELLMLDDIREGLGMSYGACERIKKNFLKNQAQKMAS